MNITTKNGIYYPDDYNKIADIPEDMKKMAESIEKIVDENITNIKNIKFEQITQNEHIQELETENERLKEDLNNIAITGQSSGENITIEDSAEARFKELNISGNSYQETRSGRNYFDASKIKNTAIVVADNGKMIKPPLLTEGNGYASTYATLKELCPNLKVGDNVVLRFIRNLGTTYNNCIYLQGTTNSAWMVNDEKTITEDMLNDRVILYGNQASSGETEQVILTDFSIMKSTETDTTWEQYGAMPSLEFRSEIRNCGDNVNEFDGELEIGSIDTNTGQNTANANCVRTKNYQKVNHSENYVLSNDKNYGYVYYLYDKNYNFIKALNQSNVLSLTKDTQYIKFRSIQSNSENDLNVKYKLERGTKATPYTPYGTGSINAKIQNENIFDGELEFGNIDNTGNNNGTSENYIRTVNYINVTNFDNIAITIQSTNKWTQEYYITYDKDKKIIQRTRMRSTVEEVNKFSKTIDVKNASYVRFFIYDATAFTTLGDNKWMLTEGTEIKPYTPHQEQNITFPLSEGQRLYKDSYLADDGIHHKRKQIVIDGTENITTNTANYRIAGFLQNVGSIYIGSCSHLKFAQASSNQTIIDGKIGWQSQGNLFLGVKEYFETVDEVKSWLAEEYAKGTPVTIEYVLAEEVIEPYTEEQQKVYNEIKKTAHSYKGTTHIFSNDEISPIFEAIYLKENNDFTDEEKEKLSNLENYVNNKIQSAITNAIGGEY